MVSKDNFLVVLECTKSIEFGIDCISYNTGPKFKGISVIPSGLHFAYFSVGSSPRQGFFFHVATGDIVVRSWSSVDEEISSRNILSLESTRSLLDAILRGDLNENLGPYPMSELSTWINLSLFINESVLKNADCGLETPIIAGSVEDIVENYSLFRRNNHQSSPSQELRPYFPNMGRVPRFVNITKTFSELRDEIDCNENLQLRSSLKTALYRDKSSLIDRLIKQDYQDSWETMLGEFQLAFILFLFLFSQPALEQWKLLMSIICDSESFLTSNSQFSCAFIRILFSQLNYVPSEFFEDEISRDNVIRSSLSAIFIAFRGHSIKNTEIEENLKRLYAFVNDRFALFSRQNLPFNAQHSMVSGHNSDLISFREYYQRDTNEDMINLIENEVPTICNESMEENSWNGIESNEIAIDKAMDSVSAEESHSCVTSDDKFSWRYPKLFECMKASNGNEDMIMTAVRILDMYDPMPNLGDLSAENVKIIHELVSECLMFLQFECK